jgi:hypothetical protein
MPLTNRMTWFDTGRLLEDLREWIDPYTDCYRYPTGRGLALSFRCEYLPTLSADGPRAPLPWRGSFYKFCHKAFTIAMPGILYIILNFKIATRVMKRILTILCLLLAAYVQAKETGNYHSWEEAIAHKNDVRRIKITFQSMDTIPDILDQFPKLEELNLNNNAITRLPPSLYRCKKLKVLELYRNQLGGFPEELCTMVQLEELSLGYNNIPELPACIGQLANLQKLGLAGNELKTLPAEIGRLQKLTALRVNTNHLKALPEEITRLKKLEVLDVGNNYLEHLPENIGNLSALRYLFINRNLLRAIPESVSKLESLQELDAVRSGVMKLTNAFSDIWSLEYVYIDERTIPFYQNPRFMWRQQIIVVERESNMYRPTQN